MALILKTDTAAILADALQLPGCTFETGYIINAIGRRDQAMHAAILKYCSVASACVTNLWLDDATGNASWGLVQIEAACSELNDEALVYIAAQIKITSANERDDFQKSFMKLLPELRAVRAKKAVHTASSAITVKNVQQLVQPRSAFVDSLLDLEVIVPDLSLCPAGRTTLRTFCQEPNLHQNLTLLVHGPTRLGKTEAAKLLSFGLTSRYLDDPCVFFLNTIDSIRRIQSFLKPGQVLLLDELDGDSSQLVHADSNIFKTLLNPVNNASIRGRNDDIELPPRLLRVITSNAESLEAWTADIAPRQRDRDAIMQRLAGCHVADRLYASTEAPADAQRHGMLAARRGFEDSLALLQ